MLLSDDKADGGSFFCLTNFFAADLLRSSQDGN